MRPHPYAPGDFFAVPMGTGTHAIGLVSGVPADGVAAVHVFARQWTDVPPPLALALAEVAPGEALWGTAVDDRALRRGKWPRIGPVPELRVEDWTLPAVEPGVATPDEVAERLTRLFAAPSPTAQLFTRGRWYILLGLARAESGFQVEIEPAHKLPHSLSDPELGAAVRAVLDRPVVTVPDPRADATPSQIAAGCKTSSQFRRGAQLLTITRFDDRVLLTPMRKLSRRGFEPIAADTRTVDLADYGRLGADLRAALMHCR